jgi:uncharacterized protein (AIM24 family)
LGDDADNVRYDAHSGQILVGFGSGGLDLVDASGQKVATIPLSSHPESFQLAEGDSLPRRGSQAAKVLVYQITQAPR